MEWPIIGILWYPSISRRLDGLERTLSVQSARIHRFYPPSHPSEGQHSFQFSKHVLRHPPIYNIVISFI